MQKKQRVALMMFLSCFFSVCFMPVFGWAELRVEMEKISGKIVEKYENRSIKLDDGLVYRPSRNNLRVELRVGEMVTLRYYTEQTGARVFFEYAPGSNSLPQFDQKPLSPGKQLYPGM